MKQLASIRLRVRLLLLVLLAVVPCLALIIYNGIRERQAAADAAQQAALDTVQIISIEQDLLIGSTHQLLAGVARLPEVRGHDAAACSVTLSDLVQQYPSYAELVVADPDGNLWCSSVPVNQPINYADRVWFQAALRERDFVMGDYVIGRATHKPLAPFAYPVLDKTGAVQAVVSAGLDLGWLTQTITPADLPPGAELMVIDGEGTVLTRNLDPDRWMGRTISTPVISVVLAQGKAGVMESIDVDGVNRLYAFSPLGDKSKPDSAYVTLGIPTAVAYAQVDRLLVQNVLAFSVVAGLALAVAWIGGDVFLLRRIRVLLRATERLSNGDLSARTGIPYSPEELSHLAHAFDQMAATLQQREVERQRAQVQVEAALEALRASEELLRETSAVAQVGGWELDVATGALAWTEETYRIHEVEPSYRPQLQTAVQFYAPEARLELTAAIERAIADGASFDLELPFITARGRRLWVHTIGHARRSDGRTTRLYGIFRDVTAYQQTQTALRLSEARYRSLFDHSPLSLWEEDFSQVKLYLDRLRAAGVTDIRAYLNQHPEAVQKCVSLIHVLDVNQATLDLLGLTDKHAALAGLDVTLTPEALATLRDEISTLAEGATNYAGEEVYRIGSGQSRVASVYVSIAPDYADTWERVVVSIVDVTERQRLETALRELNAELEQRVADRTAELRAANWRLTELDRLKDEFLSRTSHELRTPLTSIKIYLELLESGRPDKHDHYLQILKREADRLHMLIEDVLQFSQLNLGAETIAFDQIDVNNLIAGRLTTWQNLNGQHHVPLDLELAPGLPVICTNGELVAQALTRLVANALSYTTSGSVTVSTARRDDDARPWVTISVADTGPGIAPDDLPHIFERFYRGQAAADFKTPGTGVGLAIARVIADRLGGRLTVDTQVGVGSTFTLWLPAYLQTS